MSKLVKYFTYANFYKLQFQWGHGPLWACCSAQSVAEIIRLFQLLQLLIDITTFLGERVIKTTLCNALLYTLCSLQFYTHTQIHFYSGSCSYNLSIFLAYLIFILYELSKQILGCLLFSVSNFCRWQICCWRKRLTWLGWVRQIYIIYFVLTRISVNPIFEKLRPGHVALSFDLGLFCFLEYSSSLSFGNYWGMNMLLHTWLAGAVWHQEVDSFCKKTLWVTLTKCSQPRCNVDVCLPYKRTTLKRCWYHHHIKFAYGLYLSKTTLSVKSGLSKFETDVIMLILLIIVRYIFVCFW